MQKLLRDGLKVRNVGLTVAREASRPTRGIPEECSDAVIDCIR